LFVKIQKGGLEKLEFSLDLKNAKCFNSEALKNVNSNNNVYSNKDKNNNQSSSKSSSASSSKSNTIYLFFKILKVFVYLIISS